MELTPQTLLFSISLILLILHYVLVFFSTKLNIKDVHIKRSSDLVKYVIAAWIGSIIGKGGIS